VDRYFGVLHFGMRILGRLQLIAEIEAGVGENRLEKLLQLGAQRLYSVFHAVYFLTVLFTGALTGGVGGGAGAGIKRFTKS